jgi:alpha-mannosidase
LPQIYKKSGVDYFVTQKMTWNDTNQLPFKLFWWESPDGSKVLAYFPHDYVNLDMKPDRLSENLKVARERAPGMLEMMDLYGIGDHGGGPTRAILDVASHWAEPGHITPKYQFGTAQSFFSSLEKQIASDSPTWNYQSIAKGYTAPAAVAGKVAIPTWDSEMYLEYHRGVYTTQANHKRNMRDAEEQVLNAEKWASLAWLDGRAYPGKELTEDWKKVLFNQFHDLAAGSGIGVIYKDAQKDYDVVRWSTNEIGAGALETVGERIDTSGEGIPVLVYNPLSWERSGDASVEVQLPKTGSSGLFVIDPTEKGKWRFPIRSSHDESTGVAHISFHVSDVPPLGYKEVRIVDGTMGGAVLGSSASNSGDYIQLSDGSLRVIVDKKTGCLTSLERDGFETLAPNSCGNELQAFKDTPKEYDAWNIDCARQS